MRLAFNRVSATAATMFGVPGLFRPRVPPVFLAADGTPEALSIYDTSPLRATLLELVDFDLINSKAVRSTAADLCRQTAAVGLFVGREQLARLGDEVGTFSNLKWTQVAEELLAPPAAVLPDRF